MRLAKHGIDSLHVNIQAKVDMNSYRERMHRSSCGKNADTARGGQVNSDFDARIYAAYSMMPAMIADRLEWARHDACVSTGTANDLYQQSMRVTLRQANTSFLSPGRRCNKRTMESRNSPHSHIASVHVTGNCDDTRRHHVDVVVHGTVHCAYFSPVVSDDPNSAGGPR